jgi:urease accessory protein UreH
VYIVSSAASLLEGDELSIRIEVDADCHLTVRTVAAQMVHPCPGGGFASLQIDTVLAARSALIWQPEPTIVSGGADFRTSARVHLGLGAKATWQDELILGRTGEAPSSARLRSKFCADLDGRPLLRDALDTTRIGSHSSAVLGYARYIGTVATLGFRNMAPEFLQLAAEGSLKRVLATDIVPGRTSLSEMAQPSNLVTPLL